MKGNLIIISGERESGKTKLCQYIVEESRQAGWKVAGLLCPAVFEDGTKKAIEVTDLLRNETYPLAHRRAKGQTGEIQTLHWIFDPQRMEWGNRVLADATPCDLLVVDEIGPLELLNGQGWQEGLNAIDSGAYRLGVVVIRPELLKAALDRWNEAVPVQVNTGEDSACLAAEIFQRYTI